MRHDHLQDELAPNKQKDNRQGIADEKSKRLKTIGLPAVALIALLAAGGGWLGLKADSVKSNLEAAAALIPQLKQEIAASDPESAQRTVTELQVLTSAAQQSVGDPVWTLASGLPWVGPNLNAVAEVARSADDVASLGLAPLVSVYGSLDWNSLLPDAAGTDLQPLKSAAPSVAASAYAVQASSERLESIDGGSLFPQVAAPLAAATEQLKQATSALNSAADAARLAPAMLGASGSRNYLVMIQNSAEARASGGIPGALAVLSVENGRLTLGAQSSAGEVGVMSPALPVDQEQQQIYSTRLGKYMQDVNLTPDFPTAAATAQAMWERKTGQRVDGVISIDPAVLSYILQATGPVRLTGPESDVVKAADLPTELTGKNVVPTLLSDVYAKIKQPKLQDAYFAGVAKEVFSALSSGKGDAKGLISGLTQGVEEGRVLVWSGNRDEQSLIFKYPLSGSITGPSISPAQFGVYFNDGTGAKMDYYVKRTVQLIQECPAGDYSQITVRVTSTNTAPSDAATSLPAYVTGGGKFGIAPGTVQTNVTAYGPVQANLAGASQGGQQVSVSSNRHDGRPVGTTTVTLTPGETSTVDIKFNKIVQHTTPEVRVTPTVQDLKDVIVGTESAACAPAG